MKSNDVTPVSVGACSLITTGLLLLVAHRNPVEAWVVPPRQCATTQSSTTQLANGFWDWLNPSAASKDSESNKQDLFGNWFQQGTSSHSKEDDAQQKASVAKSSSSSSTTVLSSSSTDQKVDAAAADENEDEILPRFIMDQLEAYDKDAQVENSKDGQSSSSPTDGDIMKEILSSSSSPSASPEQKKKKEHKQEKKQTVVQDATVVHHGHVKWFNPRKGYGFISLDESNDTDDIFVHQSAIVSDQGFYRKLITGEPVEFTLQPGKKGRVCAAHVTGPHGKPVHSVLQQQLDGPPHSVKE